MRISSTSIQDYLKAIYMLAEDSDPDPVSPSLLAERLGVARPSVTGMLQRMASSKPKLVDYRRYRGVRLTPAGTRAALEVIRHHRLIETYLSKALDFPWDEVHPEADRLEHVISEALEERMAEKLGHPELDPHGQPIPTREGTVRQGGEVRLSGFDPGSVAKVCRVSDQDPELLRYLDRIGIRLSARLEIIDRAPFDGPLHIRTDDGAIHALGRKVTDRIYAMRVDQGVRSLANGST